MRAPNNFLIAVLTSALGAVAVSSSTQAGTPTPQEQANMKMVENFYAALEDDFQHGSKKVRSIAEQYLAPGYIQHMEAAQGYGPGREGYIRMFEQMPSAPPPPANGVAPPQTKLVAIMAQGDLVYRLNSRPGAPGQSPIYIFNMFRVQDGKLAEHWDGYSRPMTGQGATGAAGGTSGAK